MPSTPPPLPHASPCRTPWSASPPDKRLDEPNRINWLVILASLTMSFVLVVGVIAWIVAHPHKTPSSLASTSVVSIESAVEPPRTAVIEVTPAFHRTHPRDGIAKNIPLVDDNPPPLPPPSLPAPQQLRGKDLERPLRQAPQQAAGETYGTQVLFHNNQTVAADLARNEHKLLFVMHISGNFEDSCFT